MGMQTTRTTCSRCTGCGASLDAATASRATPRAGDVTVCFYCGHVLAFADDLSLRPLTAAERHELRRSPAWAEIVRLQRAIAATPRPAPIDR